MTRFAKPAPVALAAFVALLVFLPFYLPPYENGQITLVFIFAIAILGLNLIAGYTGQLTVAQSFFIGIGGYVTAILVADAGFPHLLAIPLSGIVGLVLGWLIALPVLRLRGFYLMVVTLALVFLLSPLSKRLDGLTGGADGLVVPAPAPPGGLAGDQWIYLLCLVVGIVLFAAAARLVRSPYGAAMIAIRDREVVAAAIGIDAARVKTRVFAVAAMFAGIAGSLYAYAISFVSPDSFGMLLGLSLFAGAFIGGISTVGGALIGATFVQFVPQIGSSINDSMTGVIFGAAVIVSMLLFPQGIAGIGAQLARLRRRPAPAEPDAGDAPSRPTSPPAPKETQQA
jgi:branched-chain amino acid transport system permease protein